MVKVSSITAMEGVYYMDSNTMIAHSDPKSPISEAYRVLRTNIQFSSVDKPLKVIVVTSSGPGEGKTTTIINLAITFAQSGSKVLLIDSDLRKPKIHKVFEFSNHRGLVNVLAQREDYTEVIHKLDINNIDIISSGTIPPNPSELLASNSMKLFLKRVREDYDIILIDAPPVGSVTDAAILSTLVDGTILVASSGQVKIDAITRTKNLLNQVNANIIGVVLNKLDRGAHGNNYYYYYYYYGENNDSKGAKKLKKKARKGD